ncbi:MAG: immunity 26/phosphotriesterase HocA family protein [Filimonas sp.]|nr:immunity 26/phosphotriesterase HocA family protein [Filimonas sp.]
MAEIMKERSIAYELTNKQRKYFGLSPVAESWEKITFSDTISIYFEGDEIVKILNYAWGYLEYDAEIVTRNRQVLLPKTTRGKEQKFSIPKVLKIKGSGIQFSGSFNGGGIHVYDNKRNIFFIKSYFEDGEIKSYTDIANWVSKYMESVGDDYFKWLSDQLSNSRLRVAAKEGDIIAFKIASNEYGFARVLIDSYRHIVRGSASDIHPSFHPRSLIVAPYAYYANSLNIDIDKLILMKALPALCIFDLEVYRGEMPIIGHRPLSVADAKITMSKDSGTFLTIPYSKSDIQKFIIDDENAE